MAANQLNRELLRWIQSLDLAYSIKNVKRDFSNGFLIAEVISRYYKDVSMHSYDNGIGIKAKKDNWDQLSKLFARAPDLEVLNNKADIDAIIHCQNGAAVLFLTKLYQCLTKRSIQPPPATASVESAPNGAPSVISSGNSQEVPPYAKPTGATVIRDQFREPDMMETQDELQIQRRVRDVHLQHEESLQLERIDNTSDRYPSLRSAGKETVLRGASKPVRSDVAPVTMPEQVVKEVQIKPVNAKGLEKLRANREAKEQETSPYGKVSSTNDGYPRSNRMLGRTSSNNSTDILQMRRPMDILNEAVTAKLNEMGLLHQLELRTSSKFECFVDSMLEGRDLTQEDCAEVLMAMVDDEYLLTTSFLEFPREYWKFVGALFPLLNENEDTHVLFQALIDALLRIAGQTVERDPPASAQLMTDFLLQKVIAVCREQDGKRAPLLQLVYAHVPSTPIAHLQVIKRLREGLPHEITLFIHLLSILLCMETSLDATLADLYYYYCTIGIEMTSEKLRAASLSMLSPLMAYDITLVADLLPRLTQLSTRTAWWEVKAQFIIIASTFLEMAAGSSTQDHDWTDHIEMVLILLERNFHPSSSLNLRRIGLSYLGKNLHSYQELVPLYVDILLSLPADIRETMLRNSSAIYNNEDAVVPNELPIQGTSGARYPLVQLPEHWDSSAIMKHLHFEWKAKRYEEYESAWHILQSCLRQLSQSESSSQVRLHYDQMRDILFQGLQEQHSCSYACDALKYVILADQRANVLENERFLDSMKTLVSLPVDDVRQQAGVKLVHELHDDGGDHASAVEKLVNKLQSVCDPAVFRSSLFSIALDANRD